MEAVSTAIQQARYNDAVVVNLSDEESTREIVLVAALDEENGGISWQEVLPSDSDDHDIGILRHLRTKRWVLPMLNDIDRNTLYNEAIQRACRKLLEHQGCIHVLDIGSGTGLLALIAAKALRGHDEPIHITTLEMASAMARLARLTIAANKFEHHIHVVEQHSCEFNMTNKAHLCTSELLESGLLGEGILPALRDAWARHLRPDAIMIPQQARVVVQLLESHDCIELYRGPLPNKSTDVSIKPLRLTLSPSDHDTLLPHDQGILIPIHANTLFERSNPAQRLCEPTKVMDFDFTSPEKLPGPEGGSRTTLIHPTRSGVAHGLLFFWELDISEGCTYSTEPGKQAWQDHWQPCLYMFPDIQSIQVGESVTLVCHHSDTRLDFSLLGCEESPSKRRRETVECRMLISPERSLQLNDSTRIQYLRNAIRVALEYHGKEAKILDTSDFSLCAMLAALESGLSITSVESSSGKVPFMAAQVAQLGNGISNNTDKHPTMFQIVQAHIEDMTPELLGGAPAAIVVAEPYYEILEGWHLQEALNYFYILRALQKNGTMAHHAWSIPSFAVVMACAIECHDLANSYSQCGGDNQQVCDFDHSIVNQYGALYHQHTMALPMWQYTHNCLTKPFQLIRLQFDGEIKMDGSHEWATANFSLSGCCHAVMIWVDYGVLTTGKEFISLSTNNRSHRQLIQLLQYPKEVNLGGQVRFHCKLSVGGLPHHEDHKIDVKIEI